ncbi:acylphosphatase [Sinomonas sp. JGH33]|uniref:acylphosphatase n=1 Tax=Sinomonas terricola TaxID=3110330 RepID=A0ABU5T5R7_9MICC|nr:acylphosphatase [Sinomonas sp. JGH33]MEA5454928.1 acylphosphatase [Sinomonas sp. JGH33]
MSEHVPEARLHATVKGMVQGVGFRYWTRGEAARLGLVGSAGNRLDGAVEIVAEGDLEGVEQLLRWLQSGETPGRVDAVEASIGPATGEFKRFSLW